MFFKSKATSWLFKYCFFYLVCSQSLNNYYVTNLCYSIRNVFIRTLYCLSNSQRFKPINMSLLFHNLVKAAGPRSIQKDPPFDCLAAYGALAHSVSTKLTRSMATQEDHVLQAVQADRTHGLEKILTGYIVSGSTYTVLNMQHKLLKFNHRYVILNIAGNCHSH